MKYTPRQPLDDVNVSDEHPLIEASTLVVGLGLIFATIMVTLVFLIDVALYFVPVEREIKMFGSWLPDDLVTVAPDDPRLDQLEALTDRLARHWPDSKYSFRVEINDSPEMNAMAFPGGLIIITSGLLDEVQSENELAFVIAHELGHFHNRDHIRGLGRGVVIGIMFAAIGASDSSMALSSSIADLTLRGFGRRQEADADRFALEIVNAEYGHVADAWRFFERVDDRGGRIIDVVAYLSTHPSPKDRIRKLVERAGDNGWPVSGEITGIDWAR
ncbi:MAG: M48 family metalloprotease [Woeseiaceae bacterium]|nr:M48 family metalloprotease [Woeseiaceae bacterium]